MNNAWIDYYKTYKNNFNKYSTNADKIIHILDIRKRDFVLDIGCGHGAYVEDICKKATNNCFGIDISFDAIKRNKKNLIVADMLFLPFKTKTFDKIFSLGTIEHHPDTDKILSGISVISKKNSLIYFTVLNKLSFFHITKKLKMLFNIWDLGYEKSFSTFEFENMLNKHGFRQIKNYIEPHQKINNIFNFLDNILNKLSAKLFGFFICSLSQNEKNDILH